MSHTSSYVLGDSARAITMSIADEAGAISLSGATVVLRYRSVASGGTVYERTGTGTAAGVASYTFDADDLPESGTYFGEWVVTFSGGTQLTAPSAAPFVFEVRAPL